MRSSVGRALALDPSQLTKGFNKEQIRALAARMEREIFGDRIVGLGTATLKKPQPKPPSSDLT